MPPSFSRPPDGPVFIMVKGIISARKVQEEIAPRKSFPIDSGILSDRISSLYRINP
jgi:hypothetical protein